MRQLKRFVVGILAHVDSGKTTLSEAMLYRTGTIRSLGRVDHGDSFLDSHTLERNRGITIFSKQAVLTMEDLELTCRLFRRNGTHAASAGLCHSGHQWNRWGTEPHRNALAAVAAVSNSHIFVYQ